MRPLCRPCDLDRNERTLLWMGIPPREVDALMTVYAHTLDRKYGRYGT